MQLIKTFLTSSVLSLSLFGSAYAMTSASTSTDPYVVSHLSNVSITSILTVDDGTIPKTGGGTTRFVGIPDGIGAFEASLVDPLDTNFFYLLVNHELPSGSGVVRDHGNIGAFVSKWKVDRNTLEVVEGDDLIKQTFEWDELSDSFTPGSITFNRLCSADLPDSSALYNSASGLGSQELIYLNGEETFGGRAFAHVVTGPEAGNSYHLEHFGYLAFENVVAAPVEQDITVAVMLDDASDGEVYVYVGNKQASGNEVEKAGLVGGDLYAIAVVGKPYELDNVIATSVGASENFTLKLVGADGDRPTNGGDTESRGSETLNPVQPGQNFESLKMGGPEDGAWDTRAGMENVFYFATKGTSSNGINAPTRLWSLAFTDIANPALGGTLTRLLDGPELRLGSLDNLDFAIVNGRAVLLVQEDLGSDGRLSRIWSYDIDNGSLEEIAAHDPQVFADGGSGFLTTNEESSGILDLQDILGAGWFAASVQVHTSSGLSLGTEQVERGQLVLINIDNRGNDVVRESLIASGDDWDYRVDGVDPGVNWPDQGFIIDANWNTNTGGTPTGPVPTLLGYGESAGVLESDFGQPASPRPAVTYLRREFNVASPTDVEFLDLYMKVDDGAVVYLNGVEIARYNMDATVVDNGTFASRNEPSERDWKQIPITGETASLQAAGNVIAVSLHQENAGSSDIRMDLQLLAHRNSPDGGVAPATPTGLVVSNPTEVSLDLAWTPQTDAKYFRIERRVPGDAVWTVVAREYPGEFSTYVDEEVASGVTYEYRLWAVNIHGRSGLSGTASGATLASLLPVIFEEDFETPDSFGQFTPVDVATADRNWTWLLWDFGSTGAAQGNNFGGSGATEDWLIMTEPLNFLFFQDERLFYDSQISFSGPAPQVLYSTDYDPAIHADPNGATWSLINEDTSTDGSLTPQGPFDISTIPDTGYIAFKYTGNGGGGGQSVRWTIDDITIQGQCGFDFEGAENSDIADDASTPWEVFNIDSAFSWIYDTRDGTQGAINNNFGSGPGGSNGGTGSRDWLVSPPLFVGGIQNGVDFDYYENFGDTLPKPLSVLVTNSFTGDPETTAWTDITPLGLNGSTSDAYIPVSSETFTLTGPDVRVAFLYESAGNGGGTTKRIGVDNVCIVSRGGPLEADFGFTRSGGSVDFIPNVTGGAQPYSYDWTFGDGNSSTQTSPTNDYLSAGIFNVTLTVTDSNGSSVIVDKPNLIEVTQFVVPEASRLRIASFNASMNRPNSGDLAAALEDGNDPQIQGVAETIQRANADIVVVNEFDQIYDQFGNFDRVATERSIRDFMTNYLEVAQAADTSPVSYRYFFVSPSNTGVPSGFDFNNDGDTSDPEDAYGFGVFPGQFAMVILSKHRIIRGAVRTFQNFLWKDMPGALLPPDPNDSDDDGDTSSYFTAAELDVYRLSSKTHIDVPVIVPGLGKVHLLASHPTPPVFDDGTATTYPSPSVVDWNGLRNHDEIRFWADYIDPAKSRYIYDDREWARAGDTTPTRRRGGLRRNSRFVILGDQNADPLDGDATFNPADLLLSSPLVDTSITPTSAGALEQVPASFNFRESKTASFNLRADYALPSQRGFTLQNAWVLWPLTTDLEAGILSASDHRMVIIDLDR